MSGEGEGSKLQEGALNKNFRLYEACGFKISEFVTEPESQEYSACRFRVDNFQIVCRTAKITPKKTGQFVTFWKRSGKGPIEPFYENDEFDFFIVNVCSGIQTAQFVFPKSVLIGKGIISTEKKEGKRAFRVYPPWDKSGSKQAEISQKWQSDYFHEAGDSANLKQIKGLFALP